MTTELIQRFASDHGISELRATELITEFIRKEIRPIGVRRNVDMVENLSIDELEWDF